MFRIELHSHARHGSCDSMFDEKELPRCLVKAGYNGFVISNHYDKRQLAKYLIDGYVNVRCSDYVNEHDCPFERINLDSISEDKYRECYYQWLASVKLIILNSESCGIKCYCGMEYTLDDGGHVGIIGLTVKDFEKDMILPNKDINYVWRYVTDRGGIVIQNHPFRHGKPVHAAVSGYECVSTKRSDMSDVYSECEFNNKSGRLGLFVCGGDVHSANEIGRCYTGMLKLPRNERELASILLSGRYYNYITNDFNDLSKGYRVCEV